MRQRIVTLLCGCLVMGLLAGRTAFAQYGHGSIIGWGDELFGVDLGAGYVAVAAGPIHKLGIKRYPRDDLDRDMDLGDLALFAGCMSGPNLTDPPPGCDPIYFARGDLDDDEDIDWDQEGWCFSKLRIRYDRENRKAGSACRSHHRPGS